MNKVVCYVCGTSYPESASQCPICGYAQSSEPNTSSAEATAYTYVKGGRFSKSNVRKRSQSNHSGANARRTAAVAKSAPHNKSSASRPKSNVTASKRSQEKTSPAMIVLVVVLLLAIIAVVGYIALRFFLPNNFLFEGLGNIKLSGIFQTQEEPEDPEAATVPPTESPTLPQSIPCESIQLSSNQLAFDAPGSIYQLTVTVSPSNTTDTVSYITNNAEVAIVDETGNITSVGEGSAIITVSCGSIATDCVVTCTTPATEPAVELILNRKEIVFDDLGQSWMLYDGSIPLSDITWSTDDMAVATISDGKVVAVGNGNTTVTATYQEQIATCLITCNFDGVESDTGGNISEADGNTQRTYRLYNPYGNAEDVSIKAGESFTLKLVDENNNEVSDAQWSVKNPACCSCTNGKITGLSSGNTEVSATYAGKTYTCIVRVK